MQSVQRHGWSKDGRKKLGKECGIFQWGECFDFDHVFSFFCLCFCHVFFPLLPLSESVSMAAGRAGTVIEDKEVISDSKLNVVGN